MNVRAFVPVAARRAARRYHRWLSFRRALGRSVDRLEQGELPATEFAALSYGWGNEGFSAEDNFLTEAVRQAARASGPILECGSGLSTLLAIATKKRATPVISLEHYAEWANRVRGWMPPTDGRATVHDTPLRNYGDFDWYSPDLDALPRTFSLVICDGPPGDTRGGRYGLVPVMRERLAPGCVILLDDANREAERETAVRWARELGASLSFEGDGHAFATLVLPQ